RRLRLEETESDFELSLDCSDRDSLPIRGGYLVHLPTGDVRLRGPRDRWTAECPVMVLPAQQSLADVQRFFGQPIGDHVSQLQRAYGAMLSGHPSGIVGFAGNGKSALRRCLEAILPRELCG